MSHICTRCDQRKPDAAFSSERGARRGVCRQCRNEQDATRAKARVLREGLATPAEKRCSRCGITKPSSEFSLRRGRVDNLQSKCKRCCALIQRTQKYGLAPEAYEAMELAQGGLCAICERIPADSLRVDHDHATGKVRGLICHNCNAGMGQLGDDPVMLMRAASYLLEHADLLAALKGAI